MSIRVFSTPLSILLSISLVACGYTKDVVQRVSRGTPTVTESLLVAEELYVAQFETSGEVVDVQLSPGSCVSRTETPITTTEVKQTRMKPGSALGLIAGGLAVGALGVATWAGAKNRPAECPAGDTECVSRSDAEAGGVVIVGLGGLLVGVGGYKLFVPGTEQERVTGKNVERVDSKPYICTRAVGGIPVRLHLPNGNDVQSSTDASGHATLRVEDRDLANLRRNALAEVFVQNTALDPLPLAPLVEAYQRRHGIQPGVLVASSVVGASGHLSTDAVTVELSVSPQDGAGEFLGNGFSQGDFELKDVVANPIGGGESRPLNLHVTRIDVSKPNVGGKSAVLLFDSSGSMRQNDPEAEGRLGAAQAFLDEVQGSLDVAVLDFGVGGSDGLRVSRQLQSFTRDRAALEKALGLVQSSGGTPLYRAIHDALTLLEREERAGAIVLLTDGQASGDHRGTVERARKAGVPLYVVGLGQNVDFNALRSLALETSGFFVEASRRDLLATAFRGIGTGVSVGWVRVFGEGPGEYGIRPGPHVVSGTVVTEDRVNERRVEHSFQFTTGN